MSTCPVPEPQAPSEQSKNTGLPACPFNPKAWERAFKWIKTQHRIPGTEVTPVLDELE